MTEFAARLLAWYDRHGRHDLPWQRSRTPYRVWVSEIMLQQTQVATVIPYFERFMQRFPDLPALAEAPVDDVLALWSGLGYYARARNLHRAAQRVRDEYGGVFPEDVETLCTLPGIGRSTAGAILALACDQRHAILDGNVKRVLARYHAIDGWPGEPRVERLLWAQAEAHTPGARVADYTQAIMDLGATLCRRSRPACHACPQAADCAAHVQGRVAELPAARRRAALPERHCVMLMAVNPAGEVLLERRPPQGIWGGLWSFPEFADEAEAQAWIAARLGTGVREARAWPERSHTFSHFRLRYRPLCLRLENPAGAVMEQAGWVWYKSQPSLHGGLPAPIRQLLEALTDETEGAADGTHGTLRSPR